MNQAAWITRRMRFGTGHGDRRQRGVWRRWFPLCVGLFALLLITSPTPAQESPAQDTPSSLLPARERLHVYLLLGQSNMAGRGRVEDQDRKPPQRVLALSKDLQWQPAVDPLHFDKPAVVGVGLGRTFGQVMAQSDPQITVGLVPCAVGGSPISSWQPGGYHAQTRSHPYDDALRRARHALRSGVLKGILWHQGESDSRPELADQYEAKLHELIARLRQDLAAPDVPFVVGQLGQFADVPWDDARRKVDAAHRQLPGKVSATAFVSSEDLKHKGDRVHFDAASCRELGRRYAVALQQLQPDSESLGQGVLFRRGPVNAVLFQREGHALAIYASPDTVSPDTDSPDTDSPDTDSPDTDSPDTGATDTRLPRVEMVLLAHGRRDVLRSARQLVQTGTVAVAPASERYGLEKPADFWRTFTQTRFHDYAQQSTKIAAEPLVVERWVEDGQQLAWRGQTFQVLATPGYTRGSVSYVTEVDGRRLAFTGDLIHGDGRLLDLYSFQDAIPEAQIRGYHGYASRLAELMVSLEKLARLRPDLIVPARGPLIRDPAAAIERLRARCRAVYANYLSTNALHWYFKQERMETCGRRVLGQDAAIELMPYSRHEATPNWVFENATSRLLISDSGHAFLLDCGYQRVIDAVKDLMAKGLVKQVDGLFVTHFHDDHTDMVQAAAEAFSCPVYATEEYADVLERPAAYHLPAMTTNAVKNVRVMKDGQSMKWQEFELTFHYYPGQTWYHGGLFVRKPGHRPIFFIGDSFAPSGLDDYCLQNRNLLHEDSGYLLCLKKLRQFKEDFWLVNEHIQHVFAFSPAELDYLESRYRQRIATLRDLFPWDDPNYGVDEQWAVFYPYGLQVATGRQFELQLKLTNHSPVRRTFHIRPRVPAGLKVREYQDQLTLEPRQQGAVRVLVEAEGQPGQYLVTADVRSDGMPFHDWVEALVTIADGP